MASERAKADEENLRQTAFEKGEWANQPPTDLDVDYDLLSGALGTPGSPLMSITAETLLALSFCVDELAQALSGKIDDVFNVLGVGSDFAHWLAARDRSGGGQRSGGG